MVVQQGTILKAVSTMDLPLETKAQNVWYWRLVGINPISDEDALSAIETAVENFFGELTGAIKSTITLDDAIVHEWEYSVELGWHTGRLVGVKDLDVTFVNTDEMLPHAAAAVMTAYTDDVKKRSRKSIAGFAEDTQEASEWAGGTIASLVLAALEWLANQVILGSDQLEPGLPGKDGDWWPFIAALVSGIVGSQRQRKPGIGI